jgi:hypothetical protein
MPCTIKKVKKKKKKDELFEQHLTETAEIEKDKQTNLKKKETEMFDEADQNVQRKLKWICMLYVGCSPPLPSHLFPSTEPNPNTKKCRRMSNFVAAVFLFQSFPLPRPRRKTLRFNAFEPMSLTLLILGLEGPGPLPLSSFLGFGREARILPPSLSGCNDDEVFLACPITSSTHASLSGFIETCLDLGLGPASPSGVE